MLTTSQYGEEKLHLIQECPSTYHTTFIVRKQWTYSEIFNKKIVQLLEAGFIDFWKESSKDALDLGNAIALHRNQTERTIQLNLQSCSLFFLGLIAGATLSTLVFLYEYYYYAGGRSVCGRRADYRRHRV